MATTQRDVATEIKRLAAERILVLDGAWGVLLQNRGLREADFRGERFASHRRDLLTDPDLLNLTRPDTARGRSGGGGLCPALAARPPHPANKRPRGGRGRRARRTTGSRRPSTR